MILYKRNNGYILRTIMGKHMLFPVGESTLNFQGAIILNDVAAMLWDTMDQYVTIDQLVQKVISEYDVESLQAKKDIMTLLDTFLTNSLVEENETAM